MTPHERERRADITNTVKKVGIWLGAVVGGITVTSWMLRLAFAPLYAYADRIDAKHTGIEDRLTLVLEEHEKEDARQREDMKALVQIIAAPPDSPERARRAKNFILTH